MDRDPAPEGVVEFAMPWRGVVKLPGAGAGGADRADRARAVARQSRADRTCSHGPAASRRRCSWRSSRSSGSRCGRDRSPTSSTNRLDTTRCARCRPGIVGAGRTADLDDGAALAGGDEGSGSTISFPELRQYSVFQVSRDAGVPLVLAAAILILVGLLPALYSSRRKVWVRADPDGDGRDAAGGRPRDAAQAAVRGGVRPARRRARVGDRRTVGAARQRVGPRRREDDEEPDEQERVQTP